MGFIDNYIFFGYEFLTIILPMLITYLIINIIYKKKNISKPKGYFIKIIIFGIYIFGVFSVTGSGTIYELIRYGKLDNNINLIPFSNEIDLIGYILNVILGIPLGFMLPLIWGKNRNFLKVLTYGFSFSLLIELSQLCNIRATDIDDLIINTLGAIIGYILFMIYNKIFKPKTYECLNLEPIIYIGVAFIGKFLLFNEIALAKIIYGF